MSSLALEDFFVGIRPDDRADFIAQRDRALNEHIPLAMTFRLGLANGIVRHVQVLMRFIFDLQGNPTRGTGIMMDVTSTNEQTLTADRHWLTGLPNRTAFFKTLKNSVDAAKEQHNRVGLLLINVDRFGKMNQAIGHAESDTILREIASRLMSFDHVHSAYCGRRICMYSNAH